MVLVLELKERVDGAVSAGHHEGPPADPPREAPGGEDSLTGSPASHEAEAIAAAKRPSSSKRGSPFWGSSPCKTGEEGSDEGTSVPSSDGQVE